MLRAVVEVMIADGDGVVPHHVHGGNVGFTTEDRGKGRSNQQITGVHKKDIGNFLTDLLNQSGAPRKERRERLEQMMKRPDAEMEAGLNEIFRKRSKEIGVCSFAGNARSILMWSHYGSTHAGVCLQFETVLSPRTFTLAHPVEYEKEYPQINYLTDFEDQLLIPMLRKHKGWEYEGEWRILHLAGANAYLPFDAQSLRRLVIGCRASPAVYSCIDTLLHERYEKKLPKVRVLRATQHSNEYKLQVWRVPDIA